MKENYISIYLSKLHQSSHGGTSVISAEGCQLNKIARVDDEINYLSNQEDQILQQDRLSYLISDKKTSLQEEIKTLLRPGKGKTVFLQPLCSITNPCIQFEPRKLKHCSFQHLHFALLLLLLFSSSSHVLHILFSPHFCPLDQKMIDDGLPIPESLEHLLVMTPALYSRTSGDILAHNPVEVKFPFLYDLAPHQKRILQQELSIFLIFCIAPALVLELLDTVRLI